MLVSLRDNLCTRLGQLLLLFGFLWRSSRSILRGRNSEVESLVAGLLQGSLSRLVFFFLRSFLFLFLSLITTITLNDNEND